MFHDKIKSLFTSSIQAVVSRISAFAVHPEKDFTRRKKIPADILLAFLISEGSSSTKNELLDFFDMDIDKPSDSAFNQQRAKLKPEVLESVFRKFNESVDPLHGQTEYSSQQMVLPPPFSADPSFPLLNILWNRDIPRLLRGC